MELPTLEPEVAAVCSDGAQEYLLTLGIADGVGCHRAGLVLRVGDNLGAGQFGGWFPCVTVAVVVAVLPEPWMSVYSTVTRRLFPKSASAGVWLSEVSLLGVAALTVV